jgi:hypothetical protein
MELASAPEPSTFAPASNAATAACDLGLGGPPLLSNRWNSPSNAIAIMEVWT